MSENKLRSSTTAAVMRLTNLCFALQGAAMGFGRPHRTAEWIFSHVPGYPEDVLNAHKMLGRDVNTLVRAGVPVRLDKTSDVSYYYMEMGDYSLPPVEFTAEEAQVVGMAADIGRTGGLATFAATGWTKLAAAGVHRELSETPIYSSTNDINRVSPKVLQDLLTAIRNRLRIRFDYQKSAVAPIQQRFMDPWGLVPIAGRVYLIGWDVEKDAERVFRLTRISAVSGRKEVPTHLDYEGDLQEKVERFLQGAERTDAVVSIPPGIAEELADVGTRDGEVVRFVDVDKDWLVRTAAGYASEVEVLEPRGVRDDVIALLDAPMNLGIAEEGKE